MSDELIERFDIDQHDEVGYQIGALAVNLIDNGYDPVVVVDRLRENAKAIEQSSNQKGDSCYND
ncbi:hypothetical protein OSG_eHP15_00275 [environmental Halophage eHP-15]|nr:hypothetical protein OSG_eHP15_00275 [environmental Halophage eHP-15]